MGIYEVLSQSTMQYKPEPGCAGAPERWFDIRPNPPESGWILCGLWAACTVASLGIAVPLYFKGLPLVLPFSGLELAGLGAALWFTWRRAQRRELVVISDEQVTVERTTREGEECGRCWSSPRYWTQVSLQTPMYAGHPGRLLLRYCGRELELGRYLVEEERRSLAKALAEAVSNGGRSR